MSKMKAYKATVEILLDPRIIGPDADTVWKSSADAADFFSELLSGNQDVLDWRYVKVGGTYDVLQINPDTYIEGAMDSLPAIATVNP